MYHKLKLKVFKFISNQFCKRYFLLYIGYLKLACLINSAEPELLGFHIQIIIIPFPNTPEAVSWKVALIPKTNETRLQSEFMFQDSSHSFIFGSQSCFSLCVLIKHF